MYLANALEIQSLFTQHKYRKQLLDSDGLSIPKMDRNGYAARKDSIAPFNCRSSPPEASSDDHGMETSGVIPLPSIWVPLALT